ncbi:MAG: ABC transporter ATP-binding protein [Caldilineaceae bacterium]|nr:ABC transporter ATP-binding protein [Caldilineaceae bacterium]
MAVLLDVKNLTTRFFTQDGVVHAVNGVSYQLQEGETLGIVGESGSGKSVHALSMLGLIPMPPGKIVAGEVLFNGRDLIKLPEAEMRRVRGKEIAMVFQDPMTSLNPVLTIGRQITEAIELHLGYDRQRSRKRAAELLDLVGIVDAARRLDDYPHQFSGGMRQRVMIAMALSCNPKLLIADEPTTALDVTIQAQIVELVKDLKKQLGMAIIWITHDLGVVAGIADTVQVMYGGRIVERGPVRAVFKDTRSAYTLGLLNSLPRMDQPSGARLKPIEGLPPDLLETPVGDPFAPRNPYATERCFRETPPLQPAPDSVPDHLVAAWYDLRKVAAAELQARKEIKPYV